MCHPQSLPPTEKCLYESKHTNLPDQFQTLVRPCMLKLIPTGLITENNNAATRLTVITMLKRLPSGAYPSCTRRHRLVEAGRQPRAIPTTVRFTARHRRSSAPQGAKHSRADNTQAGQLHQALWF